MDESDQQNGEGCSGDHRGKAGPKKTRSARNVSEKRRRDKLNIYLNELAAMIPSCAGLQHKLDKTSILKMTVSYMKIHNDLTMSVLGNESGLVSSFMSCEELGELMDEGLNGFLFMLSENGEFLHVSHNIKELLGHRKEDLEGKKILDVVHPEDHESLIAELAQSRINSDGVLLARRGFDVRFVIKDPEGLVDPAYELVHCIGYVDQWSKRQTATTDSDPQAGCSSNSDCLAEGAETGAYCLVGVGLMMRPSFTRLVSGNPSIADNPVREYNSRHSMDGKYLFIDPRSIPYTGYLPYEVLGKSVYEYIYFEDTGLFNKFHESLLEMGKCSSGPYRVLTKGYQWLWVQSKSYISYNHWNSKPEYFCTVNRVLSDEEGRKSLKDREKLDELTPVQSNSLLLDSTPNENRDALEANTLALATWDEGEQYSLSLPSEEERPQSVQIDNDAEPLKDDEVLALPLPMENQNVVATNWITDEQSICSKEDVQDSSDSDTDSLDIPTSVEELQNFREAQSRLQEQMMEKHKKLEQAVKKQKEQLESIQQQMVLNLRTQVRVDPVGVQGTCTQLFERSRQLSQKHEIQENFIQELGQSFSRQMRRLEKRYHSLVRKNNASQPRGRRRADQPALEPASLPRSGARVGNAPRHRQLMHHHNQQQGGGVGSQPQVVVQKQTSADQPVVFQQAGSPAQRNVSSPWRETLPVFTQTAAPSAQTQINAMAQNVQRNVEQSFSPTTVVSNMTSHFGPSGHVRQPVGGPFTTTTTSQALQFLGVNPSTYSAVNPSLSPAFSTQPQAPPSGQESSGVQAVQQVLMQSAQNPDVLPVLLSVVTALQSQPQVTDSLLQLLKQIQGPTSQTPASIPAHAQQPPASRSTLGGSTGHQQQFMNSSSVLQHFPNSANVGPGTTLPARTNSQFVGGLPQKRQQQQQQQQQRQQQGQLLLQAQPQQLLQQQGLGRSLQQQQHLTFDARNQGPSRPSASTGIRVTLPSRSSTTTSMSGQARSAVAQSPARVDPQKEHGAREDYFSNFSSEELESMLVQAPSTSSAEEKTAEQKKLEDEQQLRATPLLYQQQLLLKMHQEQRQQLLLNEQQQQLLLISQTNEAKMKETRRLEMQQRSEVRANSAVSRVTSASQSGSSQSLASITSADPQEGTSQNSVVSASVNAATTCGGASSEERSRNGSENPTFGFTEADEKVLALLLAESSSFDPLMDADYWGDINFNPQ